MGLLLGELSSVCLSSADFYSSCFLSVWLGLSLMKLGTNDVRANKVTERILKICINYANPVKTRELFQLVVWWFSTCCVYVVRWGDSSREGRTGGQTAHNAADTAWILFLCVSHHLRCHQGDHLSGKPGNVREFDSCQGNVRDFTKNHGNVRGKILSGKSCLKRFIVNCIFVSIQVFSTSTGMMWVTLT